MGTEEEKEIIEATIRIRAAGRTILSLENFIVLLETTPPVADFFKSHFEFLAFSSVYSSTSQKLVFTIQYNHTLLYSRRAFKSSRFVVNEHVVKSVSAKI